MMMTNTELEGIENLWQIIKSYPKKTTKIERLKKENERYIDNIIIGIPEFFYFLIFGNFDFE